VPTTVKTTPTAMHECGRPMPHVPGVTHRFVPAHGATFHVAQAGHGVPVVLLHGLPQHWYAWRKVISELAGDFQLFCVDLRGCGWSEPTRRGYATADQARDILAVMDALGLDQVHLIGHETGGWLGFELCRQAPDRFSGFLALNVAPPSAPAAELIRGAWQFWYTSFWEYPGAGRTLLRRWPWFTSFLLRRWAGRFYHWDEAALREFVQASRTKGQSRAIERMLWQFVLHDIPALVSGRNRHRNLAVPTRILGGELDPVCRPKAGVEPVPGGHLLPETAPKLVAAAARDLFE